MRANDPRPLDPMLFGAYLCLRLPPAARESAATAPVPALAERLGLANEYGAPDGPETIAFLRRVAAKPHDLADDGLERADAVVHVASADARRVERFGAELAETLGAGVELRALSGELRPPSYTGAAMHNYAYAHRMLQEPGGRVPNAFLAPLSKTAAWWEKGWMERHTYFLPRFDDTGRVVNKGHALSAEAGIECLLRRTYKAATEPAPAGAYDFLNYFECADADVPTFHEVCASLRDVSQNPEWEYVREGPAWHGRRVASWAELFR